MDRVAELAGWNVLALRPSAECASLRRRLAALGARLHCAAPWRIAPLTDCAAQLSQALGAALWVVTSPNAVRCAARIADLGGFGGLALAVGPGTRRALQRAGVRSVRTPERAYRSEGLLELDELRAAPELFLLTGEGGRGLLDRELAARGTRVHRVDLYRREARSWNPSRLRSIERMGAPRVLLLSSVSAIQGGAALHRALRGFPVIAASERIALAAAEAGLQVVAVAASAAPDSLLDALCRHAKRGPIR